MDKKSNVSSRRRSSNIEILRILMMLSLIAHHFTVNSGLTYLYDFNNITRNMIFLQIFAMWGKTAINVFTLITGYFMIKSNLTLRKLLKLVLEVMFYELVFFFVFLIIGYEPFSFKAFVKMLLMIFYDIGNLYVGSMIAMMVFIPFINIMAKAMNKHQFQMLLTVLLIYFTGIPTFLKHETFDFVFWLLTVYLIGGYLRLYPRKWDRLKIGVIGTCISITLMVASILAIDFIGSRYGINEYYYFVSDANKIFALTASISIFIMFKNWNIKYNRFINTIAAATFGVLMIHANSDTMRRFLWVDLFNNKERYGDITLIPYACVVVVVVYVVCVGIDLLRHRFLEKPLFKFLDKYEWLHKPLW